MKRVVIIAALMISLAGCTSKLVVRPVTGPVAAGTDEGVFYALPKTVLLIQVPVLSTQVVLGEFSELVPIFFPFDEPPVAETTYSLDEPALSSFGVPDRDQVFLAVVKGGCSKTRSWRSTSARTAPSRRSTRRARTEASSSSGRRYGPLPQSAAS